LEKMTMMNRRRQVPSMRVWLLGFLAVLALVTVIAFLTVNYKRLEGQAPAVAFDRDFKALGRSPSLTLKIDDAGTGLKHVAIRLVHKEQEVVLADESFEGPGALPLWGTGTEKSRSYDIGKLIKEKYKIEDGPASLNVSVSDHSFRHLLSGNQTALVKDFQFDLNPPRLEILSGQHYINQGGAECVVYRVSSDAEVSGIQAGPHFFPGFPLTDHGQDVHFSLFAFAYDLPADTPVTVIARDAAGNEAVAQPWQKVFPRAFRTRDIVLDDSFLEKVVAEIMPHAPNISEQKDTIGTFVEINSKLRRQNHEAIAAMSRESSGQFLWNGAFQQLSNSQVESLFADRRTYVYQGKNVDQQDHVGFDLSVVQRYPIEATNDGKVIYADYFGIYGNTVLIDHGAGLLSLYGHMSSIDVKPGQMVKKKEVLGKSGATGMAGGDHLHFGLFLHGIPVNPTEWWDPKWIQEHIMDRLKGTEG
jgi:murein DD-endopeptidase MepM/ murein hydrolase activator NlpD